MQTVVVQNCRLRAHPNSPADGAVCALSAMPHANLHEPHAPFHQPSGQQATPAKIAGHRIVDPVEFARRFAFAGQVGGLGRA